MKVAGIDPSLTNTGVVRVDDGKPTWANFKSKKTGETHADELQRIMGLAEAAAEWVDGVELVAIEGLAFMAHNTTALVQLAGLNYMLRERFWQMGIPFIVVAPSSLKKFVTGKGNAKKDSMFLEVYKRYGESFADDNVADAFGLAKVAEAAIRLPKDAPSFQREVVELIHSKNENIWPVTKRKSSKS